MERVLDIYARPYNIDLPMVAIDETSKQFIEDVIEPLPMRKGSVRKFESEYKRGGVGNLFMLFEPLAGRRKVLVRKQRTAIDFAEVLRYMVDEMYPTAPKICVILDNLNTHTTASLYKAYPPEEAKRIADRLILEHTPKHGSWLNVAEVELSVLSRQCLNRRIKDQEMLEEEITAWVQSRNEMRVKCDWQFSINDARKKLKKLYPELKIQL